MINKDNILNKLLVFGILMLFAIPMVSAEPAPSIYLVPDNINIGCGESTTAEVWFNTTSNYMSAQTYIHWDPACVNITNVDYTGGIWYPLAPPGWSHWGDYVITGAANFSDVPAGNYLYTTITIESVGSGCISDIWFTTVEPLETVIYNGTITCGSAQTFSKELLAGWNLISLPLTPTDNSVSNVLAGVDQNAVKQYNAVTKEFVDVTTTMDPGIAYFVHVTTASTWQYVGTPESSTTTQLESGLNMIGVPNCGMSVSDVMGTTGYRYAARWNATSQSYEVFNPNAPGAFHGFTTMTAGEGYFVSAVSDSTLTVTCP